MPDLRHLPAGDEPWQILASELGRLQREVADLRSTALARSGTSGFVGARAYATASTSIPDSTYTAVGLAGETFDTDGLHDPVTNNSRITVPAGTYLVIAQARFASGAAGFYRACRISKNGAEVASHWEHSSTAVAFPSVGVSDVVSCADGDWLQMILYQDSGGPLDTYVGAGHTYLSAVKLA